MSGLLPEGFEALEPFVADWALPTAAGRAEQRDRATDAERQAFFEAASAYVAVALEYLDARPLAGFDAREERLMALLLSLAHVALSVEQLGDQEPAHAIDRRYMCITRAPSDRRAA